jgi:hypothetical protein
VLAAHGFSRHCLVAFVCFTQANGFSFLVKPIRLPFIMNDRPVSESLQFVAISAQVLPSGVPSHA